MASYSSLVGFVIFLLVTVILVLTCSYKEIDCDTDDNKKTICKSVDVGGGKSDVSGKNIFRHNILTKKYNYSSKGLKYMMLALKIMLGIVSGTCLAFFVYSLVKSNSESN